MKLLISELYSLAINRLEDSSGIKWKVQFYFSNDWKFMAIILGFNAPNANFFVCGAYAQKTILAIKATYIELKKT